MTPEYSLLLQRFSDMESRVIELENAQERIFSQQIALIGKKTAVIEIVIQVIAKEFSLDPIIFCNPHAYKIEIGKAIHKTKINVVDKGNVTQACYWLCSILHHWFSRNISWLTTNFYWYRPYYVQRYQSILMDALKENGSERQKEIRARYYRILMEVKRILKEEGIYNESHDPMFDLADSLA